ncbi:MAG: methylenetetrahydrofolate reductase [Deltaproteobacteria bacterium]|nr:methylenetetrahydrofolate reductase [Deltaproteobacteria bacterium]
MHISRLFNEHRPTFSIELFPPKTPQGVENLKAKLTEIAAHHPDFISVTYGAGGGTRHTTREISGFIQRKLGLEAMAHLTCSSHTRTEIREVVAGLRVEGVENIMALRGDPPKGETQFETPPEGFKYAVELVRALKEMKGLGIAVAGYPEGHVETGDYQKSLRHQVEKIQAGADFVVSQFFLDNDSFLRWRDDLVKAGVKVPIVAGILPAIGLEQITRFAALCGARVPETLAHDLERFQDHPESAAGYGLVYALQQVHNLLSEGVDGIHLYALNRLESIRLVSALVTVHRR